MRIIRAIATVLVLAAALAGCSGEPAAEDEAPVTLTDASASDGTAVKQLELQQHAVDRLGITTGTVHQATVVLAGVSGTHPVLPYAAVVYDSDGAAWAYVNSAPRTYVRAPLTVAAVQGDVAVLTAGPADGTAVVTQGAAELMGAEAEIAGEE
jgi:hypothetical protein